MLGSIPLTGLTANDVSAALATMMQNGSAARTAIAARVVLGRALREAEAAGLVARNVARLARHPRAPSIEMRTQAAERLRVGPLWQDLDLVFPSAVGTPLNGGNLLRSSHYPLLARAGLPRLRFRDMRHTAATLMLEQGVHPKIVAEPEVLLTVERPTDDERRLERCNRARPERWVTLRVLR